MVRPGQGTATAGERQIFQTQPGGLYRLTLGASIPASLLATLAFILWRSPVLSVLVALGLMALLVWRYLEDVHTVLIGPSGMIELRTWLRRRLIEPRDFEGVTVVISGKQPAHTLRFNLGSETFWMHELPDMAALISEIERWNPHLRVYCDTE